MTQIPIAVLSSETLIATVSKEGFVIDSVRIKSQIEKIRAIYRQRVIHIHLTAPKEERYTRSLERLKSRKESADIFDVSSQNPTEENIELLSLIGKPPRYTPDVPPDIPALHLKE